MSRCLVQFVPSYREAEWDQLCPEIQAFLVDLVDYSRTERCPMPIVTDAVRTIERQRALYKERSAVPFSWHLVGCAIDMRTVHYSADELEKIIAYIRERCPRDEWEIIAAPHGTGPHVHLAFRDQERREDFLRRNTT